MPAKKTANKGRKKKKKATRKKAAAAKRKTAKPAARKKAKKKVTRKKAKARKKVAKKKAAKKKTARKKVAKKKAAKKSSRRKVAKKKSAKKKPSKKKPVRKKVTKKASSRKKVAKKTGKKPASRKKTVSRKKTTSRKKAPARPRPAPRKRVAATPKRRKVPASRPRGDVLSGPIHGIEPYKPARGEEYMSAEQLGHFEEILLSWKHELMNEVDRTVHHMQDEAANFPDPSDRATQESEFGLELRTRDRERKLLRKINSALMRIEEGSYGFCEETGEEIGLKRLEARPVATLCLEAQERREMAERQYRDRDDRYR